MKRSLSLEVITSALSFLAPNAMASMELAKEKNCMACHNINVKEVGPAYKDVAAKYSGRADAENKLVAKVMNGGGGVWEPIPMPSNNQITSAEAHMLVKWVLEQK
jgi:cytochrome c